MPRIRATAMEVVNRNTQAIFDYGMTKENLDFEKIGNYINRDKRTVQKKRQNPETFTLGDIRGFVKLAKLSDEDVLRFVLGRQ